MPGGDEIAAAERQGDPYLVYADAHGRRRVLSLPDSWHRITIGRGMSTDVPLTWDPDASRVHAELVRASPTLGSWSTTACRATAPSSTASG